MEKIKHGDFHLISGAWNDFGGNDLSCSWQDMDRENAQLLDNLVSNITYGSILSGAAGAKLFGGVGAIGGAIGGATVGALQTIGQGLEDKFPVNVAMPTVPMSPNWVKP